MARGRHWTAEEDCANRENRLQRNWPGLDRLAVTFDRTHAAVRQRASRIKARRLAPAAIGGTRGPAVACGANVHVLRRQIRVAPACAFTAGQSDRELSRGLCARMRHAHGRRFDVPAMHVGQQARDLAGSGVSGSGRRLVRLPRVAISRAGPYEVCTGRPESRTGALTAPSFS